ncbi:amino acid ABC transporter ATPase [Azospirillum argentinense]|uniref:ABC transporter ATP-binding protein n=1 Tax=Azospirillum argentinense TaxID=2970906 RepID=A0A060DEQ0_9PROT|nr:ABC transporter ATP-binding protein [Azospirillum argentinense]AIB12646.1 amino acid ABC transporter ATPase [Azospirillum argentinense]EZQ09431.1 ABC transporter ATP-binding protein [Azospirillum argentinense]
MLTVRNLSVWYGLSEVLRDVSFSVPRGEVVALLGGNGAGKTTLLKTLSGLVKPRGGAVEFDERPIAGLHPHDIVTKGVIQVPQGRFVWPSMTVADNLALGAATRHDKAGIAADLERVYDFFPRLRERRIVPAGTLSGGEQQMVAIGRALMARPRILLMDEPSHGLSPRLVQEMIEVIRRLNEEGMTIFLIEQNIGVPAAVAGTTYVLANGAIAFQTHGSKVADDPEVLSSYLGGGRH